MKRHLILPALFLLFATGTWGAKQKIIVRLREPLKSETVKIRLPEVKNARGETRDLETTLDLGAKPKQDAPKAADVALKLNMQVRPAGKGAVQVTLSLPNPGFVELLVLDFYGKNVATMLAGPVPAGVHVLKPFVMKDGDQTGIKFLTLRVNGKVVMKKVLTRVR